MYPQLLQENDKRPFVTRNTAKLVYLILLLNNYKRLSVDGTKIKIWQQTKCGVDNYRRLDSAPTSTEYQIFLVLDNYKILSIVCKATI